MTPITPLLPQLQIPQPPKPIPSAKTLESSTENLAKKPWYQRLTRREIYSKPLKLATSSGISRSMLVLTTTSKTAIHPHSSFSQTWASSIFLIRTIMLLVTPLSLGFTIMEPVLPIATIIFTTLSLIDTAIVAHTGTIHEHTVNMDVASIFHEYVYSIFGLAFDIVTCFPWVLITDASTQAASWKTYRLCRLICTVHAFPFIKQVLSSRVSLVAEMTHQYIRKNNVPSTAVNLAQILGYMLVYWHWASCASNLLKEVDIIPNSYANASFFDRYTVGFYGSAAEMLAAGFGSEPPVVSADRWLRIANMIINALFSAVFIGNISSFIIGLDSSGRLFNEKLEEVNQYINYKGFGSDIKKRILEYYRFKYAHGKLFDETSILAELNPPLRQCQSLIYKVPFFKDADRHFITQVVMILRVCHYLPGDFVIEEGTIGDQMFFIAS
eukprot:jgi/Hompol1/1556/HPOL_005632-RA